jgi:hypothetical protein
MPVDVKGRVIYNPDDKEQEYTIDCKQLGISEEGTGTLEDDIETLRDLIDKAIREEFHLKELETVQVTGYTLSLNVSIEGTINKTLDQFQGDDSKGKGKDE